jgi:hypothetical protein
VNQALGKSRKKKRDKNKSNVKLRDLPAKLGRLCSSQLLGRPAATSPLDRDLNTNDMQMQLMGVKKKEKNVTKNESKKKKVN